MSAWTRCSGWGSWTRHAGFCSTASENKFAMQAIGYRQVVEHLRGERGLAETIELVKIRTRQFAKRQLTWFRRHGNCQWLELAPDETVAETVVKLASQLKIDD